MTGGPDVVTEAEALTRYGAEQREAIGLLSAALAAGGNTDVHDRVAVMAAARPSLWFLVTGGAVGVLADVLGEQRMGPHECDDRACRALSPVLDLAVDGDVDGARRLLCAFAASSSAGLRVELLAWLLGGIGRAAELGLIGPTDGGSS